MDIIIVMFIKIKFLIFILLLLPNKISKKTKIIDYMLLNILLLFL